jgi:hypothetical protein
MSLSQFSSMLVLCLVMLIVPVYGQATEDWDFTAQDYKALRDTGNDLEMADDSSWVPKKLRDNLLKTLKWALDPKRDPRVTDGVNIRDFYHGHICCPPPCEEKKLVLEFLEQKDELTADALGGKWYDPVTEENLEAFAEAMGEVERLAADLLNKILKDDCVVIYHTYEADSTPEGEEKELDRDDPRRNIRVPIGEGDPKGYSPPDGFDPHGGFGVFAEYCCSIQFAFLIDRNGRVHVTIGALKELSKVTGRPMQ